MRVALYQCPPLPLDVAANLQRLHRLAHEAHGADVLVLPEMYLSGYNIGAEAVGALAEAQDGPSAQAIAELAQSAGLAILYGCATTARPTCLAILTIRCSAPAPMIFRWWN